ncbi:MAG TPA: Spy/CpxP family protein refolding chaperone [Noviherbaspirillum sp.]|jgi:Spy/CpxP family protein refolding chaperone|uniref:Spy/CpxP family protein refolding chaperone n=1 Tax=Noviherbaspirillum sp. TaxID=1926288 RepID=UPI002F9390E5
MKNRPKPVLAGAVFSTLALLFAAAAPSVAAESPYAGQEQRAIKALSQQEIDDYLQGRGMGTSKAAELNRYPGPRHVLDHARQLELTPAQAAGAQQLYDTMASEAAGIGRRIVDKEAALEALYAGGRADGQSTRALVREIASLQADFRIVHLDAHLAMRALLTPAQIARYDALRGYGGGQPQQRGAADATPAGHGGHRAHSGGHHGR